MSLKLGEDIGAEVHKLDQFFLVEEGEGKAVLDGVEHHIKPGFAVLVPAGTRHNIINGSSACKFLPLLKRDVCLWHLADSLNGLAACPLFSRATKAGQ